MLEISLKGGVEVKDGWIPFYEHRKRNEEGDLVVMIQAEPRHTYVWSTMTKCHRLVA